MMASADAATLVNILVREDANFLVAFGSLDDVCALLSRSKHVAGRTLT